MIFKCKMCGGTIEFTEGATVGVCDSCGTMQTLPRLGDDKKANLYDRADHFRRNNDYDKAASIYELILNEDKTDAEAYWSLVLCRYGIEYVEDPTSHKRIPTVNRTHYTSVLADEDYKSALKYADAAQKSVYEHEAEAIDEIQKGILSISQNEEPFDVFICYKESDASGRRTPDSVLATELYHELTEEGFKVFFSRITLEDKLGTAYEPYIFAALNSAKVMVVLGTKPEYFNSAWVKNEWSRYLTLIKNGADKMLIPAYRDMDPYDLPEDFSHLQAQDMSKLGFMQDLIRGIEKIVTDDAPKTVINNTVIKNEEGLSVVPLLKRVFLFLEDQKWDDANEYCEKVLDRDPENGEAYLGKLMAGLRVGKREDLKNCDRQIDVFTDYKKVMRFGNNELKKELESYSDSIFKHYDPTYSEAVRKMENAENEVDYRDAAVLFDSIPKYKNSKQLSKECLEQAETCHKNAVYDAAKEKMKGGTAECQEAIAMFSSIADWLDSKNMIVECREKIEQLYNDPIYEAAKEKMNGSAADCEKALEMFSSLGNWRDSAEMVDKCRDDLAACRNNLKYENAKGFMKSGTLGDYDEAVRRFSEISSWRDSAQQIEICKAAIAKIEADIAEEAAKQEARVSKILGMTFWIVSILVTVLLSIFGFDDVSSDIRILASSFFGIICGAAALLIAIVFTHSNSSK